MVPFVLYEFTKKNNNRRHLNVDRWKSAETSYNDRRRFWCWLHGRLKCIPGLDSLPQVGLYSNFQVMPLKAACLEASKGNKLSEEKQYFWSPWGFTDTGCVWSQNRRAPLTHQKKASVWRTHVCRLASRRLLGTGELFDNSVHGLNGLVESQLICQSCTRLHKDHTYWYILVKECSHMFTQPQLWFAGSK